MKKAAVVLVLLVLTGWAIYDAFLQKNNFEKKIGGMSNSQAVEGLEVGNRAPDFALRTLNGEEVRLSDFRGKKVIVNIWATWCPPCRAEMPDMQAFYEEYKNQGVEIVAVNLTKSEKNSEQVTRFIETYGITFTVVLDEKGEVSQRYQAQAIPTSYVIDSEGIIRNKMIGPMSKDWMMEQMKQID
ncbi:TlpA disulfide reductase family protein [Geobacillus sp. JS12]|uniref:TlpA disulfide reductase family protein n=1 Tax=Geobacillus sp. JS12 TaxID=1813182 RepID=UPI00078EA313|nr:TlpA disulfide reductase family protein [Geobacillus sp. JS12]AMQ20871.1 cytochrome C biogenesis protein [Geobacillus sp. JS12]